MKREMCVSGKVVGTVVCKILLSPHTLNGDGALNLGNLWKTDKTAAHFKHHTTGHCRYLLSNKCV